MKPIPDVFGEYRTEDVVAYRDTVTSDGPFGAESTREEVWSGKGDLQQGPRIRRRFESSGTNADAVLYLPSTHSVAVGDILEVEGQEWTVEELLPLDDAVALKART